jgi:hypothetical protein
MRAVTVRQRKIRLATRATFAPRCSRAGWRRETEGQKLRRSMRPARDLDIRQSRRNVQRRDPRRSDLSLSRNG